MGAANANEKNRRRRLDLDSRAASDVELLGRFGVLFELVSQFGQVLCKIRHTIGKPA